MRILKFPFISKFGGLRGDTIPDRFPDLQRDVRRQDRNDLILMWVGVVGLVGCVVFTLHIFIGLGDLAAVADRVVEQMGADQ
jgi:hypothetical protein